ncbi:MAG: hypothetical protein IIZ78_03440 [Clostridiales bacterium]|nr:hypothetical protein [Clostridiales bacterium]
MKISDNEKLYQILRKSYQQCKDDLIFPGKNIENNFDKRYQKYAKNEDILVDAINKIFGNIAIKNIGTRKKNISEGDIIIFIDNKKYNIELKVNNIGSKSDILGRIELSSYFHFGENNPEQSFYLFINDQKDARLFSHKEIFETFKDRIKYIYNGGVVYPTKFPNRDRINYNDDSFYSNDFIGGKNIFQLKNYISISNE